MSQMSSELSSQQSKLRLVHDKLAHDERKVESLAKYTTDLGACIKLLEDYELDLGRVRETRARHDAHLAQLAALEEERADIRNNIKVLSSKLVNAVEALGRYNAKTEDKREGVRQRKAGLEAMQRELGVRRGRVAEEAAERNREAQLVEDEVSTDEESRTNRAGWQVGKRRGSVREAIWEDVGPVIMVARN